MDERFTLEELYELFGDELPMEVVEILFHSPEVTTIKEVREQINQFALTYKQTHRPDQIAGNSILQKMGDLERRITNLEAQAYAR